MSMADTSMKELNHFCHFYHHWTTVFWLPYGWNSGMAGICNHGNAGLS